jgi:hypothetical protein
MPRERTRPIFREPSETARAWAEGLRRELEQWPGVRVTRGFGMVLIYRGDAIFAALPGTRMLHAENAIMLKFQQEKPALAKRIAADARFIPGTLESSRKPGSEGRKWRFFLLREDSDVHDAIEWLAEAYQAARLKTSSTKAQSAKSRRAKMSR